MLAGIALTAFLAVAPEAVDGDTLRAGGALIRLANIDAPERGGRAGCLAERLLAAASTARASALLASAETVRIEPTGRRDRYGRLVAHVRVDGADLGEVLVREGLAQSWRGRRVDWCTPAGAGG